MNNPADSNNGNIHSPSRSPGEWTDEEMEDAEPLPVPEIPDDDDDEADDSNHDHGTGAPDDG